MVVLSYGIRMFIKKLKVWSFKAVAVSIRLNLLLMDNT
jgi:hypothetical protein